MQFIKQAGSSPNTIPVMEIKFCYFYPFSNGKNHRYNNLSANKRTIWNKEYKRFAVTDLDRVYTLYDI